MSGRHLNRAGLSCVALSVFVLAAVGPVALAQYSSAAEHGSIAYSQSAPTDIVALLKAAIERDGVVLDRDPETGYLRDTASIPIRPPR